jgi:hypothetical protein
MAIELGGGTSQGTLKYRCGTLSTKENAAGTECAAAFGILSPSLAGTLILEKAQTLNFRPYVVGTSTTHKQCRQTGCEQSNGSWFRKR